MQDDEPHARIGYRGSAISRAKDFALKAVIGVGGALILVSAFAISLVVVAITLAVMLAFGGYLWWKTRDLRRELRARAQWRPRGEIIEGEVIPPEKSDADRNSNP